MHYISKYALIHRLNHAIQTYTTPGKTTNLIYSLQGVIAMHMNLINRVETGNAGLMPAHHHFSAIAQRYHYLRTTDPEPVALIAQELKDPNILTKGTKRPLFVEVPLGNFAGVKKGNQ